MSNYDSLGFLSSFDRINEFHNLAFEAERLRVNIECLTQNLENIPQERLYSVIDDIKSINDELSLIHHENSSSPNVNLLDPVSNMFRSLRTPNHHISRTSQFSDNNNSFEVVTSISTTSPGDLPDSLFSVVRGVVQNSLSNNLDEFATSENVVVPLPKECIRKMPSKRYKIRKKSVDEDKECVCAICYDDFKHHERYRELPCKHEFHKRCIDKWFESSVVCPMCRQDVRDLLKDDSK